MILTSLPEKLRVIKDLPTIGHVCRLSTATNDQMTYKLNPYYITGFVDGEGSFIITVNPNSKYKTNFRVKATFSIGLHERDLPLLKHIQNYFGVGSVTKQGKNSFQYRVSSIKELDLIISHFDKYPLMSKKHADFLLFKQAVSLIKQGEHLNIDGLKNIIALKASLNLGLTDDLNQAFPDITPVLRPSFKYPCLIPDLNWFAGFTDAEGCFFIVIKNSVNSTLKESVSLRFILTQHLRDEELLRSFITILGCGKYIPRSNKDYGEFVVEKFSDISLKIIPLFENYKLHGIKRHDFEDFKKVVSIMKNKDHLELSGLNQIKEIKSNVNKKRTYTLDKI